MPVAPDENDVGVAPPPSPTPHPTVTMKTTEELEARHIELIDALDALSAAARQARELLQQTEDVRRVPGDCRELVESAHGVLRRALNESEKVVR